MTDLGQIAVWAGWPAATLLALAHGRLLWGLRQERLQRRALAVAKEALGVRPPGVDLVGRDAIRDDCLRRGWPLHHAEEIAADAVGGGREGIERAERALQERLGVK